ncbi:MAG: DNA primase [Roseiflexaceae bacterium]
MTTSNVTEQIKEKLDIVEFIQNAGVQLKRSGRSYVGFCPFHSNTRTPAFTVYPDTQSYHCFGCKASGTIFDFVMRREGLEFRDALEQLARRAGITLQERTHEDVQQDQLRTRLLDINAAAAAFFHHILVKSQRGDQARAYVNRRTISTETVESFLLGYAVDDWSALLSYLTDRKGFEPEEVEAAGLAIRRENGGYYDRFRGRLMFPIRNAKGEVVAFGGRALGDAQPKYMNSPQTPLFDKGKVLYGFDLARDAIRSSESVVIVEGYVDVIIAHQFGYRNVVAPLGTALTSDHVEYIKRLVKRVYLALDADPAGLRAMIKGAQALQENPDGELVAVTGPHGVISLQRSQSIDIRVLALPDGKDPDEFIQATPAAWPTLVEQARPAMEFYIEALTSDLDLHSANGKAEAVGRLAPLLGQVTNPIEHAHYVQRLARLVDVDEAVVLRALPREQRPTQRQQPAIGRPAAAVAPKPATSTAVAGHLHAEHLLGLLLHYPSTRDAVQAKLQQDLAGFAMAREVLSETIEGLFECPEHRAVWQEWQHQSDETDPERWAATLDPALQEVVRQALSHRPPAPQAYRYANDALECATILQQQQARRWHKQMLAQMDAVDEQPERERLFEYILQIQDYLNLIKAPRRSSTYSDLHTLHTA